MSFTIEYPIARAREILQDLDRQRYPDQTLLDALNIAITSMMRVRPDIVSLQGDIPGFPYDTGSLDGSVLFPVSQQFIEPVVVFVAGWAELRDDEFAVDNRANVLITRFASQLTMGG